MNPYEALYRTAKTRQIKRDQVKADPHLARLHRKAAELLGTPATYDDPPITLRASQIEALAFAALGLEDR